MVTVIGKLSDYPEIKEIWTPYELSKLVSEVVSSANIEAHCRIIQEKYLAREAITVCTQTIRAAYDNDIFEVLEYAESGIFELTVGKIGNDFKSIKQVASENMRQLVELVANPKLLTGVPTGIKSLDSVTGGWQNSDLIILAARPGLGKTAFALNLARAAAEANIGVGIFTLEMSIQQLFKRQLSMHSLVPLNFIKTANLTETQLEQVSKASEEISNLPIFIDDEGAITLFNLRSKARKMKAKHGIGLLIVDYLQLMTNPACKGNREQVVASISQGLKALAKSLDIPVIALSQLSRAGASRSGDNKKPQLSDLRESGSIEQDANMVLFLSREDYEKTDGEIDKSLVNTAELRIAKNRDGDLREIALNTDLSTQRFFEPDLVSEPVFDNPNTSFKSISFDPLKQFNDDGLPF